ncbi:MAG: hypothetical protein ACI3YF_06665 [Prevotella sp.]
MRSLLYKVKYSQALWGRLLPTMLYCLVYDIVFERFIYETFGYIGDIEYSEMPILKSIVWLFISVLPICLYKKINNLSTFICVFLYLLVYIPTIHALFTINTIVSWGLYCNALILCVFFILYFSIGEKKSHYIELQPFTPFIYIEVVTALLSLLFLIAKHNSMHFVNIFTQSNLLYELRENNADGGNIIAYIKGWLFGAFYPYLLVCYLKNKQWIRSFVVLLGFFVLFMADMQKLTFFMPFLLIGLYVVISIYKESFYNRFYLFFILTLIGIAFIMSFIDNSNEVLFAIASIIILRTICVSGWLSQMYMFFFNDHPYTYYSHINIINLITNNYPYKEPLGVVVANGNMNANANFFLTDGIAAMGTVGITIICVLFYFLLKLINSIAYRYELKDVLIIIIPVLSCLMNISIFTTLLSKGFLILIILLSNTRSSLTNN